MTNPPKAEPLDLVVLDAEWWQRDDETTDEALSAYRQLAAQCWVALPDRVMDPELADVIAMLLFRTLRAQLAAPGDGEVEEQAGTLRAVADLLLSYGWVALAADVSDTATALRRLARERDAARAQAAADRQLQAENQRLAARVAELEAKVQELYEELSEDMGVELASEPGVPVVRGHPRLREQLEAACARVAILEADREWVLRYESRVMRMTHHLAEIEQHVRLARGVALNGAERNWKDTDDAARSQGEPEEG